MPEKFEYQEHSLLKSITISLKDFGQYQYKLYTFSLETHDQNCLNNFLSQIDPKIRPYFTIQNESNALSFSITNSIDWRGRYYSKKSSPASAIVTWPLLANFTDDLFKNGVIGEKVAAFNEKRIQILSYINSSYLYALKFSISNSGLIILLVSAAFEKILLDAGLIEAKRDMSDEYFYVISPIKKEEAIELAGKLFTQGLLTQYQYNLAISAFSKVDRSSKIVSLKQNMDAENNIISVTLYSNNIRIHNQLKKLLSSLHLNAKFYESIFDPSKYSKDRILQINQDTASLFELKITPDKKQKIPEIIETIQTILSDDNSLPYKPIGATGNTIPRLTKIVSDKFFKNVNQLHFIFLEKASNLEIPNELNDVTLAFNEAKKFTEILLLFQEELIRMQIIDKNKLSDPVYLEDLFCNQRFTLYKLIETIKINSNPENQQECPYKKLKPN